MRTAQIGPDLRLNPVSPEPPGLRAQASPANEQEDPGTRMY